MLQTTIGCFEGLGPLGDFVCKNNLPAAPGAVADASYTRFTSVMSTTITLTTVSAGIWFILQIFTAAYAWMISNGDKQAIETARKKITNSIVGLFLVVFSYAFIGIIGTVLGLDILRPVNVLFGI